MEDILLSLNTTVLAVFQSLGKKVYQPEGLKRMYPGEGKGVKVDHIFWQQISPMGLLVPVQTIR